MSQLTIQGTGVTWYVMDTSGPYPIVCSHYSTLRLAQRSLLNTTEALAFDAGATFASVAPAPGTP